MKSAKIDPSNYHFLTIITHSFSYSLKKYHHKANPRQPSCRLTVGSTIAKKKCQRHPLRILRPVATLAVSMTLFNDN